MIQPKKIYKAFDPYSLVSDKIITYNEFYKGINFPILVIDMVDFLCSELSILLRKNNRLRFSTKSIIKEIEKEITSLNRNLYSKMEVNNYFSLLDFSDYFLDEIRETIIGDYKFLIRKGNSREDSMLLIMKRLCELGEEINNEFYASINKKTRYNIIAPISKGHRIIYSKINKLISDSCEMRDYKFPILTDKIKNKIDIDYDKSYKTSGFINLQKF